VWLSEKLKQKAIYITFDFLRPRKATHNSYKLSWLVKMIEKPMLANRISVEDLKHLENYIFEPKYDGSRNLFIIDLEREQFIIKRRNSRLNVFQEVTREQFPEFNLDLFKRILSPNVKSVILDGEMIAKDFSVLMSRTQLTDLIKMKLMAKLYPVSYVTFDILSFNGRDLTNYPYLKRRKYLEKILNERNNLISIIQNYETDKPLELFNKMIKNFEGIVAKNKKSKYIQKRTNEWLKCKKHFTETLKIIGFDTESKSRPQKNLSLKVPVLNIITKTRYKLFLS